MKGHLVDMVRKQELGLVVVVAMGLENCFFFVSDLVIVVIRYYEETEEQERATRIERVDA